MGGLVVANSGTAASSGARGDSRELQWSPVWAHVRTCRFWKKIGVYELPYMESVMCECLLASGRALVTPTMVWSAKNRAYKRVPDPPYPPLLI